jgi:hypothetical protein
MPPRKKVAVEPIVSEWPKTVILEGSKLTADLIHIDGKEYVQLITIDGAATDFPLSSLKAVRPNIYKAVFDA